MDSLTKNTLNLLIQSIPKSLQWELQWILNPKFNIGVTGLIFNIRNELLLVRQISRKKNLWCLPAGWVKHGETLEKAFEREIQEELNLTLEKVKAIKIKSGFRLRIEALFVAYTKIKDIKKEDIALEIYEAKFFKLNKIPKNLVKGHKYYIQEGLKKIK